MIAENKDIQFLMAAQVDELKDGGIMSIRLKGTDILLVRVKENFYAVKNHCPHQGDNISQARLDGTILTCPVHGSKFDIVDGKVVHWTDWTSIKASESRLFQPIMPLTVYPVKIEDNKIMVQI